MEQTDICNIGPGEIRKRKNAGWIGLVIAAAMLMLFSLSSADHAWRITLFLPLFFSALGFLQARSRFCVFYGLLGVQNLNDKKPVRVSRRVNPSIILIMEAVVLAMMVTLLVYALA